METMILENPVLESDPRFNVQLEYEEELEYYYRNNPVHPAEPTAFSRSLAKISKLATGAKGFAEDVVEFRDKLYGYDKPDDGKPHLHLKPESEMKFLPDGMGSPGESGKSSMFDLNLSPPDMNIHMENPREDHISTRKPHHKKKKCPRTCAKCHGCDEDKPQKKEEREPNFMDPSYIPPSLKKLF